MDKRASAIRIGDIVSVTGDRKRADVVMETEKINTPQGERVKIRLDNGDIGTLPPLRMVKVYNE